MKNYLTFISTFFISFLYTLSKVLFTHLLKLCAIFSFDLAPFVYTVPPSYNQIVCIPNSFFTMSIKICFLKDSSKYEKKNLYFVKINTYRAVQLFSTIHYIHMKKKLANQSKKLNYFISEKRRKISVTVLLRYREFTTIYKNI
ncbi:hypothetical protein BpHYR1_018919 [Brachionus plicatilis]|uniref:Uncharacterized protein n=1 Tax=Brachionus plicatilis TaxID=10195 RepID=A0A3M7S7K3_BRAPC|nr:hypothetical protein BpHYR1_018919 [Brachionus plicatilis]